MVEATHPRPDVPAARSKLTGPPLLRFDRAERVVHWVNATLFAIVMATALMLYIPPISAIVGRRELVVTVHVYAGLLLPFPLLIGIAGRRYGRQLRADLHRINRWIPEDRAWFRRRGWRAERVRDLKQGKFNAGQKLNAAFTGGAILVMLATGSIMHWFNHFPLSWRTGATFVHDWIFIALFFTITGHVMFAVADRDSMNSMLTGTISRNWAKRHAPRWLEEEKATAAAKKAVPVAASATTPVPPLLADAIALSATRPASAATAGPSTAAVEARFDAAPSSAAAWPHIGPGEGRALRCAGHPLDQGNGNSPPMGDVRPSPDLDDLPGRRRPRTTPPSRLTVTRCRRLLKLTPGSGDPSRLCREPAPKGEAGAEGRSGRR